jgi:hypothetical protein
MKKRNRMKTSGKYDPPIALTVKDESVNFAWLFLRKTENFV